MDRFLFALTLVTALGCGLNAGVFFAFSSFVMKALACLQPAQGVAAMQAINVAAVTPAFMAALFGTAVACGVLAVWALFAWDERFAPYLLVGSLLYLVGTILLTIAYHVPRNDALVRVEPHELARDGGIPPVHPARDRVVGEFPESPLDIGEFTRTMGLASALGPALARDGVLRGVGPAVTTASSLQLAPRSPALVIPAQRI